MGCAMDDSMVPEWVKQQAEKDRLKEAEAEVKACRQEATTLKIRDEAPAFWKQLLEQVQINLNALGHLNLQGSAQKIGCNQKEKSTWQIVVSSPVPVLPHRWLELSYTIGSTNISCKPSHGEPYDLSFCVREDMGDGALAIFFSDGISRDAEESGDFLIKDIVSHLRQD